MNGTRGNKISDFEYVNGYSADVSDDDYSASSSSDTSGELKARLAISILKRSSRRSHGQKKRRRGSKRKPQALQRIAPSPIHPDIDLSLTHHIRSSELTEQMLRQQGGSLPLPSLSKFVNSFATFQPDTNKEGHRVHSISNTSSTKKTHDAKSSESDLSNYSSVTAASSSSLNSTKQRKSKRKLRPTTPPLEVTTGDSGRPQMIADISTLIEQQELMTLHDKHRSLEEALALTRIPRLLIEASQPHRLVHLNNAFSTHVIGNPVNIHMWMERQNSRKIPENQDIKHTLKGILPHNDLPLDIYPILGSDDKKTLYYLVESTARSSRKRRRLNMDQISRAVG